MIKVRSEGEVCVLRQASESEESLDGTLGRCPESIPENIGEPPSFLFSFIFSCFSYFFSSFVIVYCCYLH